jgi:hypothetical protein
MAFLLNFTQQFSLMFLKSIQPCFATSFSWIYYALKVTCLHFWLYAFIDKLSPTFEGNRPAGIQQHYF